MGLPWKGGAISTGKWRGVWLSDIVEIPKDSVQKVVDILNKNSVHYDDLGVVTDKEIKFKNDIKLTVDELEDANRIWLRKYMIN